MWGGTAVGPGALLPRLTHSGGAVLPSHHHLLGWGALPAFIILREAAASSHPHHLTTLGARESSSSASPPALPNKALWGSGHCRAAYSMGQMGPSHTWMDGDLPPSPHPTPEPLSPPSKGTHEADLRLLQLFQLLPQLRGGLRDGQSRGAAGETEGGKLQSNISIGVVTKSAPSRAPHGRG